MEQILKKYLFQKHILVCDTEQENLAEGENGNSFEVLFSLANLFGISVTEGKELAREDMIGLAANELGRIVPQPFYQGFPDSVRELSPDQLLFDQMVHYAVTYGFGNFDEAGHSLLEKQFERLAFKENCQVREFVILTEKEAVLRLAEYVENLFASTRPLSEDQFEMMKAFLGSYSHPISQCASKNTAVRFLVELRDLRFERFLFLSDVIKVADEINYVFYANENVKKLNFRNQDRKFLTKLLDDLFERPRIDIATCFEKKAIWCGLLHHLHYQPKNDEARNFVQCMRSKGNGSVYSAFEKAMGEGRIREAVSALKEGKGSGALLRNLDYVVSRIEKPEDLAFVMDNVDTKNNVILMQLLLHYRNQEQDASSPFRNFRFVRHNLLKVHQETPQEAKCRKSVISKGQAAAISNYVEENLRSNLRNVLGRVYVDENMKNIALPLQESTVQGGYGVLAKGSRIKIPEGKKIRAFTYWEKVDDIDLSIIGMDADGNKREFSWRTMAKNQSDAITYSGDETSGYNGGSEYFDVDLEELQKLYPTMECLIFCDNVFSGTNFETCICKAGFMMRDLLDSGEIFEPKTVATSFTVNCRSTFAYLFGIDLRSRELVWLNVARGGEVIVAGTTSLGFLRQYFGVTKIMNVRRFFELAATELVTDPAQADVVVTDDEEVWRQACGASDDAEALKRAAIAESDAPAADETDAGKSGEGTSGRAKKEWIRSFDFERLLALMNAPRGK